MKKAIAGLLLGSSLAIHAPAFAQGSGSQAKSNGAGKSSAGLGEIVVTAQRRSENVLSVPLSISATTGQQLQVSGIKDISSLQFNTPGFIPNNGVGYTQIYIRGIGNNIFVGADPSVATYIDGVPRIYGSMVNTFVNVKRVEVLKGAQGGLYGRNATGGVINIITRQPSDELQAQARLSYGSKNTFEAAGYFNVPLSDRVAWNLSAQRNSHDNYVKNVLRPNPLTAAMFPNGGGPVLATVGVTTPQQTADFFNSAINPQSGYGNKNFWAIDSKLRAKLTDNFQIILDGDYSRKHDSEGNQWYMSSPAYSQATAAYILGQFGVTAAFPANFFKLPPSKFTTYNSTTAADYLTDYGGSLKAKLSLPGVDVTNIFAYRRQKTLYNQNYAEPITIDVPDVRNKKWYIYEELRAVSNGGGPLHYLGGVTYLSDHFNGETTNFLLPPLYTVPIPSVAEATRTFTASTDVVHDWSIYAQVGYDITDSLNLTVSGRYLHETNHANFTSPVSADASISASKFLPSATLSYKLSGGGNIYVRYAKGFKAGGVNPVVPPNFFPTDFGKVFGPEQVNTYEAGFKDSFLNNTVQVSTAIFYNDYTGLQTTTTGNAANPALIEAIINAGSARTYGGEGSITWRVINPLTVSANVAYLDAKYKNFKNTDGTVLDTFDYSHQQMIYAPKWQLGFTANLDQPLNDKVDLTVNALASYVSDIRAALSSHAGLPNPIIDAYWLANLRVGLKTPDDRYAVSVFVNNLFNKAYQTFGSSGSLANNFVWGDPRIIGGEVQVKFR